MLLLGTMTVVSGCSLEQPGSPVPQAQTSATAQIPTAAPKRTPIQAPVVEAPAVSRQLDVRDWSDRVCALVTDGEADAMGMPTPGDPGQVISSQGGLCVWRTDDAAASLQVTIYGQRERVSDMLINADYERDDIAEATVRSQPAIAVHLVRGRSERCVVGVMIADDQSLEVSLRAGEGETGDVCDRALIVAELAVAKIENG